MGGREGCGCVSCGGWDEEDDETGANCDRDDGELRHKFSYVFWLECHWLGTMMMMMLADGL